MSNNLLWGPGVVPPLLVGLLDDAAVFPPGSAPLAEAVTGHRHHRAQWYHRAVGALLVPFDELDRLSLLLGGAGSIRVAVVSAPGLGGLARPGLDVCQVEIAVAKRGEDPRPGLRSLLAAVEEATADPAGASLDVYAEIPLTWGLLAALDELVEARRSGLPVAAKFRTGGLAAELFPSPAELAAVIVACQERGLPFKLTAGLHQALRHLDPSTGFTHHGFLNVLAATLAADEGVGVAEVAALLSAEHPAGLVERVGRRLDQARSHWIGFGTCSVSEPLSDLQELGLLEAPI